MHRWSIITCACACAARPTVAPSGDRCAALHALSLPHVEIVSARVVPSDEYLGDDVPAHPRYCRVEAIARPTQDSEIRLQVAIPEGAAWNGRYEQIGNGGFAGQVPENDLVASVARGNAAAGTDDGHASIRAIDASWALGHPEKVIDFGYRAVKETHDAALAIVRAYTGRAPRARYFTGCSDGGREGLIEAERYPDDFDGIVAGAPAYRVARLIGVWAWNQLAIDSPASYIPAAKLPAIERAAQAACGARGGVIDDPLACHFDPSVLRCTGAEDDSCLTDAQLAALAKIYAGMPGHPGLEPGAEAEDGAWAEWVTGRARGAPGRAAQRRFASTFFRYMVRGDPTLELSALDLPRDIASAEATLGPILDAHGDLAAFARLGGKLIMWHGWSDQAIAPRDSIAYADALRARTGDPSPFFRLYLAPGMLHCEGGRGPASLPVREAIEAWVENGRAPEALVAHDASGARTWTICPYPRRCASE